MYYSRKGVVKSRGETSSPKSDVIVIKNTKSKDFKQFINQLKKNKGTRWNAFEGEQKVETLTNSKLTSRLSRLDLFPVVLPNFSYNLVVNKTNGKFSSEFVLITFNPTGSITYEKIKSKKGASTR